MGLEDNFSETHAPELKLNDAAWTISCDKADVAPITKQSLPKYALEALHNEGRVPDPLAGRNEEELRWVALEVWTFTRSFDIPKGMGAECMASWELVLEGVDTVASVTLNGTLLANLQNAHRQHRIGIDKVLKPKGNILHVIIKPAVPEALARKDAYPYAVPFVQAPRALPHYNFLRKPASDFGWDWGPAFAAAGLGSVSVEACKGARLTSVMVRQEHTTEGVQDDSEMEPEEIINLHFDVTVSYVPPKGRDPYGSEYVWLGVMLRDGRMGRIDPDGIWDGDGAKSIEKKRMGRETTHTLSVYAKKESVNLWWPNGCGRQDMYGFEVYLADNCHNDARSAILGYRELSICHWKPIWVGVRDIKLVREQLQDGAGETFEFHVNGVPIFAKGANVIPLDIMPSRVTREYVEKLVWAAKDSHMNMLRVWGGGGYLPDSFYEQCSRCGILVWQEAMFACAFYPRDQAFLEEVREEVKYQSRRLNKYACMAVWGGNNELEPALDWFPESRNNPIAYAVDFAEIFINTIRPVLASGGNGKHGIPFVDSSPSNGIVSEEPYVKRWGDSGSTDFGDVHYYNYDADVLDPNIYPEAKFVSEFGFQSWPSWPVYKQVTGSRDWSPHSDMSEFRMRHPKGITELEDQMFRHFRLPHPGGRPEDFQKYIYLTQIQQGLCYQTAIGKWRSLRSDPVARTMGILYWQLNDIWAGPSWSTLDFAGGEKLPHHFVRRAYEPLMLWGHLDRGAGRVTVHLISDLMHPVAGDLKMTLVPWAAKKESECSCSVQQVRVEGRQSKAMTVLDLKHLEAKLAGDLSAGYLALKLTGTAEGKQHSATAEVYLSEFCDAKLPKHSVTAATMQDSNKCTATIMLRTNAVAAIVALGTEELRGNFSANAFTITPWESYLVTFNSTGSVPVSAEQLLADIKITSMEKAMRQPKRKQPK